MTSAIDSEPIEAIFNRFLSEQDDRLRPKTFQRYAMIIDLFRGYLNGYGYMDLDAEADVKRWEAAFDEDEDAFCRLFGADQIMAGLGEFLNYYMIRKVAASQEDLKAASTVTRKLVKWLDQQQLITPDTADVSLEQASDAAVLPDLERLSEILYGLSQSLTSAQLRKLADLSASDVVEDQLWISHVEPGKIGFDGVEGILEVPRDASDLAQVGWSVNIVLGKLQNRWRIIEVGSVYPY